MKKLPLLLLIAAMALPAWAATRTATLSIPGMTCAACPVTVKHALSKVSGVEEVSILLDKKEALVTYDDARTNVKALADATANAGYPATVKNRHGKQ